MGEGALRSRYNCGHDMLPSISLRQGCSNVWKGICEAWPHFQEQLVWRIGDGQTINFWCHRWVPQFDCLQDHSAVPLSEDYLKEPIAGFVLEDGSWDWNWLFSVLPSGVCDVIAGIAPPPPLAIPDTIAWIGSHDSMFSVKSAYSHVAHQVDIPSDPLFRLICK